MVAETWEHLAQTDENGRKTFCTTDDKCYGSDDEYDSGHVAQGKDFAEDCDTENNGGDGLQGTEYGSGGGADAVYGCCGAEQGDGGGQQSEGKHEEPEVSMPFGRQADPVVQDGTDSKEHPSEQCHVKGELQRREMLQTRTVDGNDINGIGYGGDHHECGACK